MNRNQITVCWNLPSFGGLGWIAASAPSSRSGAPARHTLFQARRAHWSSGVRSRTFPLGERVCFLAKGNMVCFLHEKKYENNNSPLVSQLLFISTHTNTHRTCSSSMNSQFYTASHWSGGVRYTTDLIPPLY